MRYSQQVSSSCPEAYVYWTLEVEALPRFTVLDRLDADAYVYRTLEVEAPIALSATKAAWRTAGEGSRKTPRTSVLIA